MYINEKYVITRLINAEMGRGTKWHYLPSCFVFLVLVGSFSSCLSYSFPDIAVSCKLHKALRVK